ncbi:hypothetical protein IAD21_02718 [Abditibacteriota bacterium]|nr:hypothetical protein IAD21_02718 [Abditibacteriota bacterium]
MTETKTREEAIAKIAELTKSIRIAMLTTIDESGELHARPMAAMDVEFDGDLWFFTAKSSPKVHDIDSKPTVNVAFSDPENQNYVSLAGRAELVIDRALFEKYWSKAFEAWFPQGLDDPELALLKINVESAQYWDAPSSVVSHIAGFIQSKLTGEGGTPLGDFGKVDL